MYTISLLAFLPRSNRRNPLAHTPAHDHVVAVHGRHLVYNWESLS